MSKRIRELKDGTLVQYGPGLFDKPKVIPISSDYAQAILKELADLMDRQGEPIVADNRNISAISIINGKII